MPLQMSVEPYIWGRQITDAFTHPPVLASKP